jgi:hypothetical protein
MPLPLCRRAADITLEVCVRVCVVGALSSCVRAQGLRLLSYWSARVREQAAWKYAHPNKDQSGEMASAIDYERAVRYNYTSDERFVLAQYLGLIKVCDVVSTVHVKVK